MDFSKVEELTIKEGVVDALYDKDNRLVWEGSVTIEGETPLEVKSKKSQTPKLIEVDGKSVQKDPLLPSTYTRLEYIENGNNTFINTGVLPTRLNNQYYAKINVGTLDSFYLFQSRASSPTSIFGITGSQTGSVISGATDNNITSSIARVVGNLYTIDYKVEADGNRTLSVANITKGKSDTVTGQVTSTQEPLVNLGIFGNFKGDRVASGNKVYELWYKENNQYILNLIPAKRNSDGVIGFYNTVDGRFLVATSGSLIAGPSCPTPTSPLPIESVGEFVDIPEVPSEYELIEYLQTDGDAYIDTLYTIPVEESEKMKYKWEYKGVMDTVSTISRYALDGVGGGKTGFYVGIFQDGKFGYYGDKNDSSTGNVIDASVPHIFCIDYLNGYASLDGVKQVDITGCNKGSDEQTLGIFCFNSSAKGNYIHAGAKRYWAKLWKSNELILDLVPVRRLSDNKLGMYNKVDGTFLTNAGSGSFTAGKVVKVGKYQVDVDVCPQVHSLREQIPLDYLPLTYIESTGTQYIDTGVCPTSATMGILVKWAQSYSTGDNIILGSKATSVGNSRFWIDFDFASSSSLSPNQIGGGFGSYSSAENRYYPFVLGTQYTVKLNYLNDGNLSVDGKVFDTTSQHTDVNLLVSNKPIYLFAGNVADTSEIYATGKMYEVCLTKDNDIIYHAYPVKRISDNELGMYDIISGKFFTNNGTDSFVAGPALTTYTPAPYPTLPLSYTPLTYIAFDRESWVDTLFKPNSNTKISITYLPSSYSAFMCLYGTQDDTKTNRFYGLISSTQYRIQFNAFNKDTPNFLGINTDGTLQTGANGDFTSNKEKVTFSVDNFNKRVKVKSNSANLDIDASSQSEFGEVNCQFNMLLGSRGTAGVAGNNFVGNIYEFKVWEANSLIRHLIPVKRDFDGTLGFYDLVGGNFFTNQGTGSFVAGDSLPKFIQLPIEYNQLEYLQSDGNSYLDTGIKLFGNDNVACKYQYLSTTTSCRIFGNGQEPPRFLLTTSSGKSSDVVQLGYNLTNWYNSTVVPANNVVDFKYYNGAFSCNGETPVQCGTQFDTQCTENCLLFGGTYSSTVGKATAKIWEFVVERNGNLICYLVPAQRRTDKELGMYDIISGKFLTNAGTGNFSAGPYTNSVTVGDVTFPIHQILKVQMSSPLRQIGTYKDTLKLTKTSSSVTRNVGGETLGETGWTYQDTYNRFFKVSTSFHSLGLRTTPFLADCFSSCDDGREIADVPDNSVYSGGSRDEEKIFFKTTSFTNTTSFVNAVGDTQVYYPLNSPTTETVDVDLTQLQLVADTFEISTNSPLQPTMRIKGKFKKG